MEVAAAKCSLLFSYGNHRDATKQFSVVVEVKSLRALLSGKEACDMSATVEWLKAENKLPSVRQSTKNLLSKKYLRYFSFHFSSFLKTTFKDTSSEQFSISFYERFTVFIQISRVLSIENRLKFLKIVLERFRF